MAQVCTICETRAQSGHNRSHSNRATKRRFNVNLQKTTIKGKSVKICTSCMRTLSKQNA